MANEEHLTLLRQGILVWNGWREEHPDIRPDLSNADLSGMDLNAANLQEANLREADLSRALIDANLRKANLFMANLSGANLTCANLREAELVQANLSGAMLPGSILWRAKLNAADLRDAVLVGAYLKDTSLTLTNLTRANLSRANLAGATLRQANLTEANVTSVSWNRRKMRHKYQAIRGLDSCYGNALFRRAAADQDFLDTLEEAWRGSWRAALFWAWGLFDYGRSLWRVLAFGVGFVALFGAIFGHWHQLLNYDNSANTPFSPFYFSIVTFTTLGFGDVRPNNLAGEILASSEVLIGYITLGLLIAVLAEKLARRA
jgi:uncharacterized protein YjbI with pentapeptide repeats